MEIPKIFVDFNNADENGRVRLNTNGTLRDIELLKIELKEDRKVLLDDDEGLTTIGNLKYSNEEQIWVAEINWETL